MPRPRPELGAAWLAAALVLGAPATALAAQAELRYSASVAVHQDAPLILLPLSVDAYAHSRRSDLADLRLLDARGERVPFALLAARAARTLTAERVRDIAMYPLPAAASVQGEWRAPLELRIDGERITVARTGPGIASPGAAGAPLSGAPAPATRPGGWVFDLGPRAASEPATAWLRLAWSAPQEFSAAFELQTSGDLQQWRGAGSGHLLALHSASGNLTQPLAVLPAAHGRFVRLVWTAPADAPALVRAEAVAAVPQSEALDPPSELELASSPEPQSPFSPSADDARRTLHFDLGAAVPVSQLDLRLGAGNRVAPVRLQARQRLDAPWRELPSAVFYRLERQDGVSVSPALRVGSNFRFVRVIADARSPALPATTRLVVHVQLASLVFPRQGQAPYVLWAGAATTEPHSPGALPLATLVPSLDDERARFGHARLGPWGQTAAAGRHAATQERLASWRPWLLWSVLLAGVAALSYMVWRLARSRRPPEDASTGSA